MIVFADGPNRQHVRFKLRSASLRDPSGHMIPTRWLDQSGPVQGGVGFVIPVPPLTPATAYTARVTFVRIDSSGSRIHKRRLTKTWRFTTTPLLTGAAAVNFTVTPQGQSLVAHATPLDPAYDGRLATFRETIRSGGSVVAQNATTAVIGRDYLSYGAPGPGVQLDFVLDVHAFSIGSTSVAPFTLGPLTFSG